MTELLNKKILALSAGILLVFAYSPFNFWFIAPISLALLLFTNRNVTTKQALLHGFLFGLGWFGAGISWVHVSIAQYGGMPLIVSLLLMFLLVSYLAIYPALACWLTHKLVGSSTSACHYLLLFIPLFIFAEYLRGTLLTGFPWLSFGYTLTDTPFNQLAPWIGELGLTIIVMLLGFALFYAVQRAYNYSAVIIIGLLSITFLAQFNPQTDYSNDEIDVVLVQGNIKQELRFAPENFWPTMSKYRDITRPFWQSDLIVWPEAAIPEIEVFVDDYLTNLDQAAAFNDTALITGIIDYQLSTKTIFNNLIAIGKKERDDTQGQYTYLHRNRYSKHQLLPIGEFVPFEDFLRPIAPLFDLAYSSFTRGEEKQDNLRANGLNILPAICYEIAFPELVRGNYKAQSDILFTVSNDAWFGQSHGPDQHMQIARMRALELGLPLIRVTNNGISGVYDPLSQTAQYLPQFETAIDKFRVPLTKGQTWYSLYGTTPIYILLLLGFFANLIAIRKKQP